MAQSKDTGKSSGPEKGASKQGGNKGNQGNKTEKGQNKK